MSTKLTPITSIALAAALLLSACNNPRAESAGVWYNPLSWGDKTLTQSLAEGCVGGATQTVIADSTYPCPDPAAETEDATPAATDAEFDKGVETVVKGPAIVQWWDGSKTGCGIVKVNIGETFTWTGAGHWWQFGSQAALEADWQNSVAQYSADNPQCTKPLPAGVLK